MTEPEVRSTRYAGRDLADRRDIQAIVADETLKRHDMATEILLVAADMQNAIDQVRAAREALMGLIHSTSSEQT